MAHLASVYPFQADQGLGTHGPYLGTNITAGFAPFHFDPFELYTQGVVSGPNCLVMGEVGTGKSATVKAFLGRSLSLYGTGRFVAVLDPKGEYGSLAQDHSLPVIRLRPGGASRLNPMDPHAGDRYDEPVARQGLATSLIAGVIGRHLDPIEDALVGWAVTSLARTGRPFTLRDLIPAVAGPSHELVELSRRSPDELAHAATPVVFALDKLVNRTLAGMFDGPTTVDVDWAAGPGIVIDLSAVYDDSEALPLVMLAATSWLGALLRRRQQHRHVIQVIDEAWAAVAHGARHFQASLKLSRALGVSTWLVCHRPSDLTAQADDGTSNAKIAAGLLSDIQTRIILRQASDQVPVAQALLGLNPRETSLIGRLVPGRALWRMHNRSAVTQLVLTERERQLFDTDAAMAP
jgi:type IV secretory pathway VirB4 component